MRGGGGVVSLPILALVLVVAGARASAAAATSAPAHKGKTNVSPVCAASGSAWKSKSACSSFETGICNTVEGCANNFITAAKLDSYSTPIYFETTVKIVDGKCQQSVYTVSPNAQASDFRYDCYAYETGGVTKLDALNFCPQGWIAVQSACRDFNDLTDAGKTPLAYAARDYARCTIDLLDPKVADVGLWLMCVRAGSSGVAAAGAGRQSRFNAPSWQ